MDYLKAANWMHACLRRGPSQKLTPHGLIVWIVGRHAAKMCQLAESRIF